MGAAQGESSPSELRRRPHGNVQGRVPGFARGHPAVTPAGSSSTSQLSRVSGASDPATEQ